MLKVPEKNEFPGTGPQGNGISPNVKNQGQWIHLIKTDSCESCHQLGNEYTRTIPALFRNFDSPAQAWMRRVQSGQAGQRDGGRPESIGAASGPRRSSAIGPAASRTASCPRRRLRGRRASSATS